jgi:hypothetical protein
MSTEIEMNNCNTTCNLDPDLSNSFRLSATLGFIALSCMLYSIFTVAIS